MEYIPQKTDLMPLKKHYLNRARITGQLETDDPLRRIVDAIYKEGLTLVNPAIYFETLDITAVPVTFIPGKFAGAKRITLFASTLGFALDDRIQDYMSRNMVLDSQLLDAWSSESLEALNDAFDTVLRNENGEGTIRFSPGYGDIAVNINRSFLEFLNVPCINAHSETGILSPVKSTTCMIGWYA